MDPPPATTEEAGRQSTPTTVVLHGRRLFVARLVCVVLAALTVGLFIASVLVAYEQLSTYNFALSIVSVLGFWAIGAILFWKSSGHRVALYASAMLVTFGAVQVGTLHWLVKAYPVWALALPVDLLNFVGNASFFVLFCVFPDGRFVPRWTRWAAIVGITYWLLDSVFSGSPLSPGNWPLVIHAPLFLGLIGSLVVAQIYRYRWVSGPDERQQTKWVVFGLTATIVVFFGAIFIGLFFDLTRSGIPQDLYELVRDTVMLLSALLIPLSIGVAILRYRLWDVDLIIRRSLVIGPLATILTVVFALAEQLLVPFLLKSILGMEDSSTINTVASVVIIVVLFKPLHARLNAGVNRLVDWLVGADRTSESLWREEDTFVSPPSEQQ
jgi:hypothetical protein